MDELRSSVKPFDISKQEVWDAYRRVRDNRGAPGIDEVAIDEFEKDLKGNLYKIWNRMSSGSYFPPPVKAVEIPKPDGSGPRMLGVPTIADRIAQTVAARRLEAKVEPIFHPDSYGYRPERSALDAVGVARRRCWDYDWVVDLDVAKFFDSVPWDLVVKAVQVHATDVPWVLLYVKRWLAAPLQFPDGSLQVRDRGTPQGSAISPVLANLFMHYAFDQWMVRNFADVPFERYADDVIVHCRTRRQAHQMVDAIADRMAEVGLQLHPTKTKIVYCKDGKRRAEHEHTEFTFLGFTFRARGARGRGETFTSFLPAVSKEALGNMSRTLRRWRLHLRMSLDLAGLAERINPIVRGWLQYYGTFYRSALDPLLRRINTYLMRFLRRKYQRLRRFTKAKAAWQRIIAEQPGLFAHWRWQTAFN